MLDFVPHGVVRNPHLMTLTAAYWPRRLAGLPRATERLFEVEPGTKLLAKCHWQAEPQQHATIALVHGLEGSSESLYMLGLAEKAYCAGFNVLRLNQRNCGGTEHLTPTLYHSGLSGDCHAVLSELIGSSSGPCTSSAADALPEIFFVGYSMGGNLTLKLAGELGADAPPQLRGICAVCPGLDLAASADAIARPENLIYQWHFLRSLKQRMRRKARLFPQLYSPNGLRKLRTLREFDDAITAPHGGYRDAANYYEQASALRVIDKIRVPTLILTAQDDPLVPYASFRDPALAGNPHIMLVAPRSGGHCGFISRCGGEERFWAEARVVEFCREHSQGEKQRNTVSRDEEAESQGGGRTCEVQTRTDDGKLKAILLAFRGTG